ncbi:uromodulin-like [Colossoma macropomum]|uniref:uromodulin-like n=1 Tax=Colossoma macropomum TaxID=42526 RepID=UPI001864047D|nr:uromodulin-like [Colossoma macropomum]
MYDGQDVWMPESCFDVLMCGTTIPFWINGTHPLLRDKVVTLQICSTVPDHCCFYTSSPIRVKAYPGNYYVYEFVSPSICSVAYCADVTGTTPATTHQPLTKHFVGLRMKLSSANNLEQSSSMEDFLKQLKEELVRKGLPGNITIHLKNISKWSDEN